MKNGILLVISLLLGSCASGLYTVNEIDLNKIKNKIELNLSDFDIYTYNICEDTKSDSTSARFCNCVDDFYVKQDSSTVKKVEEVYMLIDRKSDMVIYLTTFSHKYIKLKKGFLNDKEHYNNQVVLDQIEYIYIGKRNETAGWIHFPSENKAKDIIIHYEKNKYPKEILLTDANIATAENKYSIDEKFSLDSVFKDPIRYKMKPEYQLVFYKNNQSIGKKGVLKKFVEKIFIVSEGNKVCLVFSNQKKTFFYKMTEKRIRYRPNFFLIDK